MGFQAQLCRPNGDKSEQYRTWRHVTALIPVHVSNPPVYYNANPTPSKLNTHACGNLHFLWGACFSREGLANRVSELTGKRHKHGRFLKVCIVETEPAILEYL